VARSNDGRGSAHKNHDHFRAHVLPALQRLGGYEGATLNSCRGKSGVEILVITRWTSIESVRAFAGPDVKQAVVAEEAAQVLMRWAAGPSTRN
jgi:hypothetical protein